MCTGTFPLLTKSVLLLLALQEITQRILEAVGTIAGSSLEQTSWLSRNLEVKAQPQVSLEDSDADEDVCGMWRRGGRKRSLLPRV